MESASRRNCCTLRKIFPLPGLKLPYLLSRRVAVAVLCECLLWMALLRPESRADTIQLEQKPWEALANHDVGDNGATALAVRPQAWLHGETPSWILHYRRITEAKRVALEIDFHINFVGKFLGAKPEQLAKKGNVFIFEDEKDWKEFIGKASQTSSVPTWSASFAYGSDLYLNVRDAQTGMFDSQRLAHETTHAVVARVYPRQRCPLWLSEGFAEEMSGRSVGARMGQYNQRLLQRFQTATLTPDQLTALTEYPTDLTAVAQLYQSSEKLVRFLMTDGGADRFPKFFEVMMSGSDLPTALQKIYADKYPSYDAFKQKFARLPK